ncbi:hypothetical protein NMG29_25855 [Streptomyces cocklensis]|uniref:Uncharacterized protein n=1 Tax=Actinacidiphila cocklensis TaxID=887465 RepID=A0A9W4GPC4_9ACTN|nr:hypothetical protein [Actinacidiphila cocklensis]MDD1061600.1 hypothetical protein [Actinacidiphila cocklensis]CAG6392340.1 conserved hypothetical protein [Actinacidiphila cocklensis]
MDQGDAAVWAAGLGIAGTLFGALGGALVQSRAQRRQVHDQEIVDVGHWLRGQRQVAFAAVLEASTHVTETLGPVIAARLAPDWSEGGDHRALWEPCNGALGMLKKAVTAVAITGPPHMADLAAAVYDAEHSKADSMRQLGLDFDGRVAIYVHTSGLVDAARERFTKAAQEVLASTSGP